MERDSPLKQWARKISPSKSRNKPLPPAPKQQTNEPPESPTRIATRSTSGRMQSQEIEQSVAGQRKSSMSKMRHFFSGSKDHGKRTSPPPQRPVPKEPYQRSKTPDILSSNSRSAISKDHIRRHSTLSPGTLTQRILALESELVTTKKELARFRVYEGDQYEHRQAYNDYNSEVEARYRRLVGQGHLDGLMETLMSSPERRAREQQLAQGGRSYRSRHFEEDIDPYHHGNLQYNQYQSKRSRIVSAPQATIEYEDRESILSAQQFRAEAELKELRTKMRQAAWEQVQAQTRAQLYQQAYAQDTTVSSEADRPPSRGKDRSVSAPQQQSHQQTGTTSRQALRRVPGGLKKDLPALPEERNEYRPTVQPMEIKSSIRAVSAPLERTNGTPPGEHENHATFVFPPPPPPPPAKQDTSNWEQVSDDPEPVASETENQPRKAHRRRPSERDITFLHENKRVRVDPQVETQMPAPSAKLNDPQRTSKTEPSKNAQQDAQTHGDQRQRKAPLGESTASNVTKVAKKAVKVVEPKVVTEETETIDLDALSTPTKSRASKRHVDALAEDNDDDSENNYSIAGDQDLENQDEDALQATPPDTRPPSPERRHLPRPTRLETVREDFEWDDEIF